MSYHIRQTCRLCNSSDLREILDLGYTPLANELCATAEEARAQELFPLYLVKCGACEHVQLPVVVNPERLFLDYVYESGTAFNNHLESFAKAIPSRPGAFIVEIGSNDGTLLAKYKAKGCEVLGIDPANNIAEIAETRNGVPTIREFFSKKTLGNWNLNGRKADLILALNVFAHADDLRGIADGVHALLADGGSFIFEVGYLPAMLDRRIYRTIYHEHLSYHHLEPLKSFFERSGLRLYYSQPVSTQGGSVRGFVCKMQDDLKPDEQWGMLALERKSELDTNGLRDRIVADRHRIRQKLDELKAQGAVICGYGAPAQLTTTYYALGIDADDVTYICDDSKLKQGKHAPGTGIPIMPPRELHVSDACLIFSANFSAEIKKRHSDYKGEWVDV